MKTLLVSALALCAIISLQADTKSDLQAASKKLADAPNYSWVAKTEIEGGQFTPAPVLGKAEKGGYAVLTTEREGTVTTAVHHGTAAVVKTDDGWKTSEELQGGGGGGRGMRGANLLRARRPDAELAGLADKVKELKSADGVITGDLTEDGAKALMTFGRGGQNAPRNAKGSIKFWLKEGAVAKMEIKTSGTMSRNGEDREIASTRTVEIKDVGTTKLEVPEDARKKLGK